MPEFDGKELQARCQEIDWGTMPTVPAIGNGRVVNSINPGSQKNCSRDAVGKECIGTKKGLDRGHSVPLPPESRNQLTTKEAEDLAGGIVLKPIRIGGITERAFRGLAKPTIRRPCIKETPDEGLTASRSDMPSAGLDVLDGNLRRYCLIGHAMLSIVI